MSRNLLPKAILILVLVVVAAVALYPPSARLKPGIDLAGGTSLIYAINTEGLNAAEERGLAQRMVTVLRRRIDPANIQNLVWRPQGNTRFEIQMPLASKETREKRLAYETRLDALLNRNINPATIMRALQLPAEERTKELTPFAQGDPNRLEILNNLASVFDERQQLQKNRDERNGELTDLQAKLAAAGVDMSRVEANRRDWAKLDDAALQKELTDFLGAPTALELLTSYIKAYKNLSAALDALTSETGVNERYEKARRQLDRLNMSREQIALVLDQPANSPDRAQQLAELKKKLPDRVEPIDQLVAAYDEYHPFRGRLDDPMDLRRMLRGAGILEFRIVPTADRPDPGAAEIQRYVEALAEKGPQAASDSRYRWIEIEKLSEWNVSGATVGQFGGKAYTLASNKPDEAMLHRSASAREWKLQNAYPTTDQMGRRAIGFTLDVKGGNLFYKITSKNPNRPLAIILDDVAVSAPNITPDQPIRQHGIITGTFSQTQVSDMVDKLNAGSLPARLIEQPISERVIGPSIGADNLQKGIRSGLIGLAMVVGFMIVYYFVGGGVADVALLLNVLFTLAIMAMIRATFTLPGIAGFILTIGMSVDANVLIFERIREEQERGVGLATAIRNGYARAFSAIFDSNLTTILTAAILYYVASEDVKGFAIVLMLGIASSMFTAIFVTRVILDFLVSRRLIKDRLMMLQLIRTPNINWMGLRPVFYTISAVLVFGGLIVFFARDKSKYDIEFTGGTSVQVDFKPGANLTRQNVEDRIQKIGAELKNDLASANVWSVGNPVANTTGTEKVYDQYEITTTATNKLHVTVTPGPGGPWTVDSVTAAIRKVEEQSRGDLGHLEIAPSGDQSFALVTNRVNPALMQSILSKAFPSGQFGQPQVDEVVGDAILQAFQGQLQIQQNLQPTIVSTERITDKVLETYPELAHFVGGLKMDVRLAAAATPRELDQRMKELQFRPDTQKLVPHTYELFGPGLKPVAGVLDQPITTFTFASITPDAGLRDLSDEEWTQFVDNEKARVQQATERETSLTRVTQIDPSVGSEASTRAIISVVLSLAAIVAYIWLRFGSLRFGLAAIIALFHDVSTALGAIGASVFIGGTVIGQALLISDFRINGTVIAAILTLLGYSLNDTIVVFDRIRENRRKVQLTPQSVTSSINQTLSRTLITGVTTLMVVAIMYVFGGPGLRGFNFVIFLGLLVGTYSSIAIAAPLLLVGLRDEQGNKVKAVNPVAKAGSKEA